MLALPTIFMMTIGCATTEPPTPTPDAPELTETTITMGPAEPTSGMKTVFRPWAFMQDVGTTTAHPATDSLTHYVAVRVGSDRFAMGFEELDDTWRASLDLNQDGTIGPGESVDLLKNADGGHTATLTATVQRAPDASPVTIHIRLATFVEDEVQRVHVVVDSSRQGTLPDGMRISARSYGGFFDVAKVKVTADLDGDGQPDLGNKLATFSLADGPVPGRDTSWLLSLTPEGQTLTAKPTDDAPWGTRAGQPAPAFSVTDTRGVTHTGDDYRGKHLLLDFWATWCGPCIADHPKVLALSEAYDVRVLGVSADDDPATVERWLRTHNLAWPTATEGREGPTHQAFGVSGWPTYALLDPEGHLMVVGSRAAVETSLRQASKR